MSQKTALENSKSGFSDDEDTLSNMNMKNMEKMKVKYMSINSHYFI